MVKKVFLMIAAAGLVMGAAAVVQPDSAYAGTGCKKAAKAQFADDRKARKAYKKECKAGFKAWWPAYYARHR